MEVIPAIDLIGGKCVRLIQGEYHRQITYEDDPLKQARIFSDAGAKWLHIVDNPGVRKIHSKPIPRIGGVPIFVSMIGLVVPVLLLPNPIGEAFRLVQTRFIALLGAAGFYLIGKNAIKGPEINAA